MQSPVTRNATYVSAQTQNELIEVTGKYIILKNIVNDVTPHEITFHSVEYLTMYQRRVVSIYVFTTNNRGSNL